MFTFEFHTEKLCNGGVLRLTNTNRESRHFSIACAPSTFAVVCLPYLERVAGHQQQPPDIRGRPAAEEHDHDHEQHPASGDGVLGGRRIQIENLVI